MLNWVGYNCLQLFAIGIASQRTACIVYMAYTHHTYMYCVRNMPFVYMYRNCHHVGLHRTRLSYYWPQLKSDPHNPSLNTICHDGIIIQNNLFDLGNACAANRVDWMHKTQNLNFLCDLWLMIFPYNYRSNLKTVEYRRPLTMQFTFPRTSTIDMLAADD